MSRDFNQLNLPKGPQGLPKKVSQFFGEDVYDLDQRRDVSQNIKKRFAELKNKRAPMPRDIAEAIAQSVSSWAQAKGVTHFCHWFQPLTGSTAEKHDAFLDFEGKRAIDKLGAEPLMQGEPDASSFPNGGLRSTFEARGYTSWEYNSPIFIITSGNGKTLCIPTAFVSYHGEALDIKTPLLRSMREISDSATKFLKTVGKSVENVFVTCGAEQEYFLVDEELYNKRPDLKMTGRTLFGKLPSRNQQLDDHYFGTIPERVQSFMNDLDIELYKMGVPAKTRHNEVAPGQFELACIYREANIASDHNQLLMTTLKKIARRHSMVALLHEKPFADLNGSGKHLNWSMATSEGENLLSPGENPHSNFRFLSIISIILRAIHQHSDVLRASIAGHGNDHRLGGHEAPPSIISVFLGKTLGEIFESIINKKDYNPEAKEIISLNQMGLVDLVKDNTDRNRTSPFAFTGDKFEFRAVGSSQAIGFPLTILNASVCEAFHYATDFIEKKIESGADTKSALFELIKDNLSTSYDVVFNGDGYHSDWLVEAEKRGLPNLRNTIEALDVFQNNDQTKFLIDQKIFSAAEIEMRHNVLRESYVNSRIIEINEIVGLVKTGIIPVVTEYEKELLGIIQTKREIGLSEQEDLEWVKEVSSLKSKAINKLKSLDAVLIKWDDGGNSVAESLANQYFEEQEELVRILNRLESYIPKKEYPFPNYTEMLFH